MTIRKHGISQSGLTARTLTESLTVGQIEEIIYEYEYRGAEYEYDTRGNGRVAVPHVSIVTVLLLVLVLRA